MVYTGRACFIHFPFACFFFFIRFIFQFISCIPFLIENNEFICSKKKKKKRKKVSFELNIERIKKKRNIRTVKMLLLTAGRTRQGVSGRAEGMRGSKMPEICKFWKLKSSANIFWTGRLVSAVTADR